MEQLKIDFEIELEEVTLQKPIGFKKVKITEEWELEKPIGFKKEEKELTLKEFIRRKGLRAVVVPIAEFFFGATVILTSVLIIVNGLLGLGGY